MAKLAANLLMILLAAQLAGCGSSSSSDSARLALNGGADTASLPAAKRQDVKKFTENVVGRATPGNAGYRIGPQDVIEITVFKVNDLNRTVQVTDGGSINVPLLGDLQIANSTARDVEALLAKRWGDKYLRDPQVSVFIKEYNSQRVTVDGAVKRPGIVQLKGPMTLMQAIANAQGLEETADSEVLVFREEKGKRQVARFDLAEIRKGNASDPAIEANDVIVVGSSSAKEMLNNFSKIAPIARLFVGF